MVTPNRMSCAVVVTETTSFCQLSTRYRQFNVVHKSLSYALRAARVERFDPLK